MFNNPIKRSGTILVAAAMGLMALAVMTRAQDNPDMEAGDSDPSVMPQPLVLHVHHHYYTPSGGRYQYTPAYRTYLGAATHATQDPVIQRYSQAFPTGAQNAIGAYIEPWKQDWAHLGFTGYLGQQGEISGLIVDKVTPGSSAEKMGLIPGDFILTINGTPLNSYRQVAVLFEETREDPKHEISFEIWNPHTRRKNTVRAILKGDKQFAP
jgi:membrane-associated protease RseP (regulator of RpoE activity)